MLPMVFLALIATAVYYINQFLTKPKFVRYPAFGIDLPVNYAIHGIDVSRYQHNIDWKAVQGHGKQTQSKIGQLVDPVFARFFGRSSHGGTDCKDSLNKFDWDWNFGIGI